MLMGSCRRKTPGATSVTSSEAGCFSWRSTVGGGVVGTPPRYLTERSTPQAGAGQACSNGAGAGSVACASSLPMARHTNAPTAPPISGNTKKAQSWVFGHDSEAYSATPRLRAGLTDVL